MLFSIVSFCLAIFFLSTWALHKKLHLKSDSILLVILFFSIFTILRIPGVVRVFDILLFLTPLLFIQLKVKNKLTKKNGIIFFLLLLFLSHSFIGLFITEHLSIVFYRLFLLSLYVLFAWALYSLYDFSEIVGLTKYLKYIFIMALLLCFIQSFFEIWNIKTGVLVGNLARASGTTLGANSTAIAFATLFFFFFPYLKKKERVICFFSLVGIVFLTGSRSTLLFSFLASGVYFGVYNKKVFTVIVGVIILTLLSWTTILKVAYEKYPRLAADLLRVSNEDLVRRSPQTLLSGRWLLYERHLEIIRQSEHKLIGRGLFTSKYVYAEEYPEAISEGGASATHNTFIQLLSETGAVGVSIWGLLCFFLVERFCVLIRKKSEPLRKIVVCALVSVFVQLLWMLTTEILYQPYFWVMVAFYAVTIRYLYPHGMPYGIL